MERSNCILGAAAWAAALAVGGGAAQAALLAYEGFDIGTTGTSGTSVTGAGGSTSSGFLASGTGSTWTAMGTISNPTTFTGRTYTDGASNTLPVVGNAVQAPSGQANVVRVYRTLATDKQFTVAANSTGTLYASFIIRATPASNGDAGISFFDSATPTASSTANVTFGVLGTASGNYRIAGNRSVDNTATSTQTVVTPNPGVGGGNERFVVLRLDYNTNSGANETVTAWLNPTLTSVEANLGTAYISNASVGNLNGTGIRSIGFYSNYVNTGSSTLLLDEIRLGTTLAAVVPTVGTNAISLTTSAQHASGGSAAVSGGNDQYLPGYLDLDPNSNKVSVSLGGFSGGNTDTPVIVALDVEGGNQTALFDALDAAKGTEYTITQLTAGTVPDWVKFAAGNVANTDWEYLVTFSSANTAKVFNFEATAAGVSLDRLAVIPEPASAAVIGLAASAGLLARRRRAC